VSVLATPPLDRSQQRSWLKPPAPTVSTIETRARVESSRRTFGLEDRPSGICRMNSGTQENRIWISAARKGVEEFTAYFADLDNPRDDNARHNLLEILVIALCTILCGERMVLFGERVRATVPASTPRHPEPRHVQPVPPSRAGQVLWLFTAVHAAVRRDHQGIHQGQAQARRMRRPLPRPLHGPVR
jgi:hypothetical protein